MNREPFADNEWYHCFTRGVEKRTTFQSHKDYDRFLHLLYLCNNSRSIKLSDHKSKSRSEIFSILRDEEIVHIGAYALMPNHFHLLIRQSRPYGISEFMQKIGTGYTMYFNIKNDRIGNLFVKPFRSRHVAEDRYFQKLISYIHLNPYELEEPGWKYGKVKSKAQAKKFLTSYIYSSFVDYELPYVRAERSILNHDAFDFISSVKKDVDTMVTEASEYYADMSR